jgi:DNA-binding NarL/FixJ family response regulator
MRDRETQDSGDPVQAVATLLLAYPATENVAALARLLECSPSCIVITDVSADFNCNYMNRAARRRFRGNLRHVVGRPLRDILADGKHDEVLTALREAAGRMTAIHRRFSEDVNGRATAPNQGELLTRDWRVYPMIDKKKIVKHLVLTERIRSSRGASPRDEVRLKGAGNPPSGLTSREWEVAELVALGLTNRSIAQRLFLSRPTVATHVARILGKLSLASRVQLAAWVARQ